MTNPARFEEETGTGGNRQYGGRYLIRGGATRQSSDWKPQRLTLVEFESMEKAKAFYNSPEYRAAIKVRTGAAKMKMLLVQGI